MNMQHTDPNWRVFGSCDGEQCRPCPICFVPVMPYRGTQGHSGTDTSKRRAKDEATSGKAGLRQFQILTWLYDQGPYGGTWNEAADALHLHHGQASGSLSVLHLGNRVRLLEEVRDKCHPYVHPRFVEDRETRPRKRSSAEVADELRDENARLTAVIATLRDRLAECERRSS